ncbi:MAG: hypothetical protein GY870_11955 [archaeon]|nr:hypothetical protein [archaeon]
MNKKRKNNIFSITFKLVLVLLFLYNSNNLYSTSTVDSWAISRDAVIKENITPSTKYIEFSPAKKPKYENKIMNYIVALDQELMNEIKIIRIQANPEKDFLMVKNKLYSIKESYNSISKKKMDKVIKKLTSRYGKSSLQKDEKMVIYTFSNNQTKVLVYSYLKSKKAEVYLYAKQLFKMLISDM